MHLSLRSQSWTTLRRTVREASQRLCHCREGRSTGSSRVTYAMSRASARNTRGTSATQRDYARGMFEFDAPYAYHSTPDGTCSVALIRRPKLAGLGWHYGVVCFDYLHEVICVVDVDPGRGLRFCSLDEFAPKHNHRIEDEVTDYALVQAAVARLDELRYELSSWDFHIANANCEHFAEWVITGKLKSRQIEFVGIIGLSGLVLAAFG